MVTINPSMKSIVLFPLASLIKKPHSLLGGQRVMATQITAAGALDSIIQHKRALRSRVRKDLRALDPVLRKQQDEAVQEHVLKAPWFNSSKSLCAYISCEGLREVDTSKLISNILHAPLSIAKKLYVPRVEDNESKMRMLHITNVADLTANSMNILEPTPLYNNGNQREDVMEAEKPVDLLLLPGLAFDCSGRRLGRGGGYYDHFIKTYMELAAKRGWQPPLLVALAYSAQILNEAIPVSALDVPVDAIVSPSGVISISPNALERM